MNQKDALAKAIELAGGQTALANQMTELAMKKGLREKPIRQSHIWTWLNRDEKTPPDEAVIIEQVLNGQITKNQLVFGNAA